MVSKGQLLLIQMQAPQLHIHYQIYKLKIININKSYVQIKMLVKAILIGYSGSPNSF